ncbi:ATP-binding protein [Streptomyces pathocidini]|uniref:ATP-binding protein n=1 Tax=Streptomyces pathocidini TaxID=1650571 RepID=UPI0033D78FF5
MSTTRPYSPGDRGPESDGASPAVPADGEVGEAGEQVGRQLGRSARETGPQAGIRQAGTAQAGVPQAGQVRRLRLGGAAGIVPTARDFTRQALYDWGWLPAATADQRAAAEDVLLVVSELVTNACLHAEGPEELRVGCKGKVLRLEVVDLGTGSPAPRTPHRAGRPGGHGMFIVQRLCLDWGVVRNPDGVGKTVWAELAGPA